MQSSRPSRPSISAVHVVPIPAPRGRLGEARLWQLSLGLRLDQVGTFWGDALIPDANWSAVALQAHLASLLVGRPFDNPLSLIADIETWLDAPQSPLAPAIGYGLSLAAVAAEAHLQNRTMAAAMADIYQLPLSEASGEGVVPLLAEAHDFAATAALFDEMIADQPAAIGYRFSGGQLLEAMGQHGEILQRFVRELQERITVLGGGGYAPHLYVALAGGFGELAAAAHGEVKSGPVLGNLWGLEQAARPLPVLVEDPVVLEPVEAQATFLAQLRNFAQIRKMGLQFVGRAHAGSLDGITALTRAKGVHLIWLDGMQLGSLSRLVAAVRLCRDAGVGVVLGGHVGESVAAATAACQIALACRPDYLLVRPGQGTGIGLALMRRELLLASQTS